VRLRTAASFLAIALLATGCTGEVGEPGAAPTSRVPVPVDTGPHCPPGKRTAPQWPKDVPDVIPRPEGATIQKVDLTKGNVTQVRFTVPMSLRESVLFVVDRYPKEGFSLGRGDAEATEADAPFNRGDALRGLVRIFVTPKECETLWVLAVVRNPNAPYDITYTPAPTSTPLPFG
jgi:hypothetical protein